MINNTFRRYWKAYGGWGAIFKSRYFHYSIIISALLFPMWSRPYWWDLVIEIMPNLLGFSLGGYAMWLSVGDNKFRELVVGNEKDEEGDSPYLEVCATFAHFIFLQILSILLALGIKAFYFTPGDNSSIYKILFDKVDILTLPYMFFCFLIFIYAIVSTMAATMALFKISTWYDDMITKKKSIHEDNKN